jgi:hypothetical protein
MKGSAHKMTAIPDTRDVCGTSVFIFRGPVCRVCLGHVGNVIDVGSRSESSNNQRDRDAGETVTARVQTSPGEGLHSGCSVARRVCLSGRRLLVHRSPESLKRASLAHVSIPGVAGSCHYRPVDTFYYKRTSDGGEGGLQWAYDRGGYFQHDDVARENVTIAGPNYVRR